MGITEDISQILQNVLKVRGGTLEELQDKLSTDERIVRTRYLAAFVLGEYFGDQEDDRIVRKLNCNRTFLQRAERLGNRDAEFIEQLAEIRGKKPKSGAKTRQSRSKDGSNTDEPKKEVKDESPTDLLFRIVEEHFRLERKAIVEKARSRLATKARRTVVAIAQYAYSMKPHDISALLACREATALRTCGEIDIDFARDRGFNKEVREICEKFGIQLRSGLSTPR